MKNDKKIIIPKKKLKGVDGHKTFSIRIPENLYNKLDDISSKTELSRNEVINILLSEAVEITDLEE